MTDSGNLSALYCVYEVTVGRAVSAEGSYTCLVQRQLHIIVSSFVRVYIRSGLVCMHTILMFTFLVTYEVIIYSVLRVRFVMYLWLIFLYFTTVTSI